MTDEQIIKALECCKNEGIETCRDCPLFQTLEFDDVDDFDCGKYLYERAIDIINRQKAEIERLQKEKFDSLNCQFAEMYATTLEIATKKAKSEARKEFAERLEEKAVCIPENEEHLDLDVVFVEDIDNLLKEMDGEQ